MSLDTQEVVPRAEPNCSSQTTRVPPQRCRNSLGLTPLVGTFPPKGFEGTFPRTVRLNARHHLLGLEGQIVFYVVSKAIEEAKKLLKEMTARKKTAAPKPKPKASVEQPKKKAKAAPKPKAPKPKA